MNKILLALTVYFISVLLYGQSASFELLIDRLDDQVSTDMFEDENGVYYCTGFSRTVDSDKRMGFLFKISSVGEITDSTIFAYTDKSCTLSSIIQDKPGELILSGYLSDTTEEHYHTELYLQILDYELNVLKENIMHVSDTHRMIASNTSIGLNNDILVTGGIYRDMPPYTKNINARFNNNLDSIHASIENKANYGLEIKQLSDSTYWLLNSSNHYLLCDTLFNTIDWYEVPEEVDNPVCIKWDSDTTFFFAGAYYNGSETDVGIIRQVHPFDQAGYLFNNWGTYDTIDMTAINGALDFRNKDSVFIGATTGFLWPEEGYQPSCFSIIQTDSLLNIRWERFYGSEEYYYVMYDVLATRDGGCMLTGTRFDYGAGADNRDIYILKLNSEGLILGEHNYNKPTIKEAIVYPNPGANNLKIRVAVQYQQCSIELYDIKGNKVLTQQINGKWGEVNTRFLPQGNYIYQIYNKEGLFESGKWVKH